MQVCFNSQIFFDVPLTDLKLSLSQDGGNTHTHTHTHTHTPVFTPRCASVDKTCLFVLFFQICDYRMENSEGRSLKHQRWRRRPHTEREAVWQNNKRKQCDVTMAAGGPRRRRGANRFNRLAVSCVFGGFESWETGFPVFEVFHLRLRSQHTEEICDGRFPPLFCNNSRLINNNNNR